MDHEGDVLLVDLPNGITREVTVTTAKLVRPTRGLTYEIEEPIVKEPLVEDVGEPSVKAVEIDLDPRMPEMVERVGTTEDTMSILVDAYDPSKVLKIGSNLGPKVRGPLV